MLTYFSKYSVDCMVNKLSLKLLPFHEGDHIHEARCADHWLVCKNSSHSLLHTVFWFQGWKERLDFFSEIFD